MSGPLAGVKVVEVAAWTFVPSSGAVLADLGADVIKVEPPNGDPQRGLKNLLNIDEGAVNPFLEMPNRGKRSITIDLSTAEGLETLLRLCESADVFLTSYLPQVRRKLGIDVDVISARNPRIIYAKGSGWGPHGPMSEAGGYDLAAGWATTGMAYEMPSPTGEPNMQPRAFYDLIGGNTIAGAVSAALFQRERTGHGDVVDVSLMNVGMWALGMDITGSPYAPKQQQNRLAPGNVLSNVYPTQDGRWIYFVCLQSDRFWAELCALIGASELATDPRYETAERRFKNRRDCVEALDAVFTGNPLAYWLDALKDFSGVWAPVLDMEEVARHVQVEPNGYLPEVEAHDGSSFRLVAPPVRFGDRHTVPQGPAPEVGQHTEFVLIEAGFEWEEIEKLRESGALG
jgi:crotonobetainyl-CoA:carnitine CoA-transferase CaiB-like acyl-CoA transferase